MVSLPCLSSTLVKIMLIDDCCGFRFVVRLPLLHAKHSPPRPSCILRKSLPNSLTIPHRAHCFHNGFCHHPALSNSGSCCPLHQEPGKSRTGLSLSNQSASYQSKRPCQAWILLAFLVACVHFVTRVLYSFHMIDHVLIKYN